MVNEPIKIGEETIYTNTRILFNQGNNYGDVTEDAMNHILDYFHRMGRTTEAMPSGEEFPERTDSAVILHRSNNNEMILYLSWDQVIDKDIMKDNFINIWNVYKYEFLEWVLVREERRAA